MFAMVIEKFGVLRAFIRRRRYALIMAVCLIAFTAVMIYALTMAVKLNEDVLDYEGKIAIMSSRMERWEAAADQNEILIAENSLLESKNTVLASENNALSAANSELERRNGELLKKYDGLSKPN
ncbi:hypothetical protein AGMMS49983_12030 [Clostridia bacterium]|nr:hypothetical protein AGMMS49983_12030 [Clostridia bacterium]